MSWLHLPTELKLNILQRLLSSPSPIDHPAHIDSLVCGQLEVLISTHNTELVNLSLEAYYKSNTFVVKTEPTYRGSIEHRTFRPRAKHTLHMQRIVDETAPASPPAVDSGYASRTDDVHVHVGVDVQHAAAVNAPELACALEKAAVGGDSAAGKANRQIKLFECFNRNDTFLRSQRRTAFWTEVSSDAGSAVCEHDPFFLPFGG